MTKKKLLWVYRHLFQGFGPQHWWPAESAFEVIVGAILTQSTNWANVEKAIAELKQSDILSPMSYVNIPNAKLERLIKPTGYFRQKAKKLKAFVNHLTKYHGGSLQKMFRQDISKLRTELLSIHGIGPETADSIILYAANKPSFVVDAYTRRIGQRLGLFKFDRYDEVKKFFEDNLPRQVKLFNEFHALIVKLGKDFCRTKPLCSSCPLSNLCPSLKGHPISS